ncbi:MAG TPA: glycine cleavage system aminomethyltransferase GcvT [Clostridia bacterium]|nr:glycine cleavage system aminomethyltransferase GcvT [Clostridia bacterium]
MEKQELHEPNEPNEPHEPRKTPLYDEHVAAGGKIVDFHGWLLPVQYGGILKEHECVRSKAGLFDVSHMGELEVSGRDAVDYLQWMLTNDIAAKPGKAVYSPMCYPDGGTVDDLIVYKLNDDKYLLVVNAANIAKDFEWLKENKRGNVTITDRSEDFAQLALQGPESVNILRQLMTDDPDRLKYYHYATDATVGGIKVMLSRSGYTGEDGFEIYCRPEDAARMWELLIEKGGPCGLEPAGLGARDTLRLESAMPLYGQELSEVITPVMAGLQRFVKPEKGDFIGRKPLAEQLSGNPGSRLAGFEMIDRAVPRSGYEVSIGDCKAGYVTSGGFFPTLKKNMGLALIDLTSRENAAGKDGGKIDIGDSAGYRGSGARESGDAQAAGMAQGNIIRIKVREAMYSARIVELPFYRRVRNR